MYRGPNNPQRVYRRGQRSRNLSAPHHPLLFSSVQPKTEPNEEQDELRLVLLGKTGAGKSASGNTILGEERFISEVSMGSVTRESKRERGTVEGRELVLVDTPGLFDTDLTVEQLQQELIHCVSLCLPGPHVFLLVLPIERYTAEQQQTVEIIQKMFQTDITNRTILVFSHADKLNGTSIEEFISRQNEKVQDLVEMFGKRYVAFDNKDPANRSQVARLLDRVDEVMVQIDNKPFTNPLTEVVLKARTIIEQNQETRVAERKEKIREVVQKMADARWAAFIADIEEDRRDSERKRKRIKSRIDQITTEIKNEEQNAIPFPDRLMRFKMSLKREEMSLRKLMEEEKERRERMLEERMSLNKWINEEQQRKESQEMEEIENETSYNKYLIMLSMFMLGVGGATFAPALLAFLFPVAQVVEVSLSAQILSHLLNLGSQATAVILPVAVQVLKTAALTRCSIQ